jgi:glycine hydroxymethyltransferase
MARVFKENGYKCLTDGTDSHIILLDLGDHKLSGRQAADLLEEKGITVNKNGVPNDPRSFVETSGIRIGTAAETTRNPNRDRFEGIAARICYILDNGVV